VASLRRPVSSNIAILLFGGFKDLVEVSLL
jgi:hypothetical protein